MVGSNIRTVHPGKIIILCLILHFFSITIYFFLDIYYQVGGNYLISKLSQELKESGKNPYCIPVGGSNVLVICNLF